MEMYLSEDFLTPKMMMPVFHEETQAKETPLKPRLTIKRNDQSVIINFDKKPDDLIRLFGKRSSEDNFTLLAEVSGQHFIDTRPNSFNAPELREYKAHYVHNNVQIGESSDVVLIIKK